MAEQRRNPDGQRRIMRQRQFSQPFPPEQLAALEEEVQRHAVTHVPTAKVRRLFANYHVLRARLADTERRILDALAVGITVACLPGKEAADMRRALTHKASAGAASGADRTPP